MDLCLCMQMPPSRADKGKAPASEQGTRRVTRGRGSGVHITEPEEDEMYRRMMEEDYDEEELQSDETWNHVPIPLRRQSTGAGTSQSDLLTQTLSALLQFLQAGGGVNHNPQTSQQVPNQPEEAIPPPRRTTRGRPPRVTEPVRRTERPVVVEVQEERENRKLLADFINLRPPAFKGESDPDKAEHWIREMEKIFDVFHCTPRQMVELAAYMLKERAGRWWDSVKIANPDWRNMVWEDFIQRFNEEYFPCSIRQQKVLEFDNLRQEKDSVTEYAAKFSELSRFVPWVATNPQEKSRRFKLGLHNEIKRHMMGKSYDQYEVLVEKARRIELDCIAMHNQPGKRSWSDNKIDQSKKKSRAQGNDKPDGNKKKKTAPQCPKCQKFHYGECLKGKGVCYKCGKAGHVAKDCRVEAVTCFTCGQKGHRSPECPQKQQHAPQPIERATPQVPKAG